MEIITPPKQEFMAELQRQEPAVRDSTIVMKQKTCRRLYFYEVVCGYRPSSTANYLAFGSAYHKFREVLEKTKDLAKALGAGIDYWRKHGSEPMVGTKFDFLTGQRLLASMKKAFEWWQHEKEQGNIEVIEGLIEGPTIVTLSDNKTKIGARFDQMTRWRSRLWPRDFKTTSKMGKFYERTLEPNDQFSRQSLIAMKITGEPVQGVFVEVLYNTKKTGPEIKPLTTGRTEDQLLEFEQTEIFLAEELAACREKDFWPKEEKNCPYCPFRSVCTAPNERAALAQLKTKFQRKVWDFTKLDLDSDDTEEGTDE